MSGLPKVIVEDWSAWALGLVSKEDWSNWDGISLPIDNGKITVTTIPSAVKRRCSELTKMCLETANQTSSGRQVDYAVFCSQHGELDHSSHLLQALTEKETLSPTKFTQSVHNTSSGLYSILNKVQNNCTSLAAGKHTFLMGFLEAVSWLKKHPDHQVLLVMADHYIPELFKDLNIVPNNQYAVALLLRSAAENEAGIQVDLSESDDSSNQSLPLANLPSAINFLRWYLSGMGTTLNQYGNHCTARWCFELDHHV
tara:strand:- start:44 stop:808 length:765 start_codon:yes stop_codon:yes gene_type:complete